MRSQNRPASKKDCPEVSKTYERAHPEDEGGLGEIDDVANATPTDAPDVIEKTVKNRQDGARQLNGEDDTDKRAHA